MLVVGAVALVGAIGVLVWRVANQSSTNDSSSRSASTQTVAPSPAERRSRSATARVVVRRDGNHGPAGPGRSLSRTRPPRALLLGGLTASDMSTGAHPPRAAGGRRPLGQLPTAVHDTAAVRLGRDVYVFGGGTGVGQLDSIVRVDPPPARRARGHLPAPSSDQAAAAIGGTAYVVGGYTGTRWLDTIVAWRPGAPPRVVAHLPVTVRYAAVTAADGEVVIAGGSLPDGTASRAVLAFLPATGRVVRLGRLPAPTTHAAAATLGNVAYVVGGRGTNVDTPTARIVAIDPAHGESASPVALASAPLRPRRRRARDRILLAGGRGRRGTEAGFSELAPAPPRTARATRVRPRFRAAATCTPTTARHADRRRSLHAPLSTSRTARATRST